MTIKESFEQYRYIDIDIEEKKQKFDKLRILYTDSSCISKSEAENLIISDIYKLIEAKHTVEEIISKIDDHMLSRFLTLRYINGLTAEQSAEKLGKSERHMRRLQKNFFEKISKCP